MLVLEWNSTHDIDNEIMTHEAPDGHTYEYYPDTRQDAFYSRFGDLERKGFKTSITHDTADFKRVCVYTQ